MTKKYEVAFIFKDIGFGSSVLQMLLKTSIKKNLYYEIKDRIDEEQFDGVTIRRKPKKCRVYGSTSSFRKRSELIELLHQRVQHHRDKFATREIYNELCTMVVKPNGKTEHADDAHDDMIFSYLWALYVFYHGEDLATRFHLMKTQVYTDDHYDETSYSLEEEYMENEVVEPLLFKDSEDETVHMIEDQMSFINKNKRITMEDFAKQQLKVEEQALQQILLSKPGREAVAKAYNMPEEYFDHQVQYGYTDIGDQITEIWYEEKSNSKNQSSTVVGNLSDIFNKL